MSLLTHAPRWKRMQAKPCERNGANSWQLYGHSHEWVSDICMLQEEDGFVVWYNMWQKTWWYMRDKKSLSQGIQHK